MHILNLLFFLSTITKGLTQSEGSCAFTMTTGFLHSIQLCLERRSECVRYPTSWLYHRGGVFTKNHLVLSFCEVRWKLAFYFPAQLVFVPHSVDPVDEVEVLARLQAHNGRPSFLHNEEIHQSLLVSDGYGQPDFSKMLDKSTAIAA
uniref:Putative secreted protein n=1 Tax=Ixodes ricinus TaxID=34613 RepID=A0A6B0UUH2_IXORI